VSGAVRLLLPALLLLALPPAAPRAQDAEPPEELFRRAETLAAEGEAGAALALYREWLRANCEAQDFGQVLSRAADTAAETADALRLLAEFAPRVQDQATRETLLERQAALLRLSGRIEEALVVQLGLPETPPRLVERAGLCLELGLTGEAEQILQRVRESSDAESAAAARVLLAGVYLATDRETQAEAELRGLLRDLPQTQAVPGALLALGEALRERGDARGSEAALAELKSRFPASPEALLAAGEGRRAALPMRLLPLAPQDQPPPSAPQERPATAPQDQLPGEGPAGAQSPSEAASTPAVPPSRKSLVQAGSFRDPENARDLARDLAARGFAARVVEKPLGETRYYRVVVGPEQSPQDAQALILQLKDAGYEGFLLLE
jgi:cell division septation protein DedD